MKLGVIRGEGCSLMLGVIGAEWLQSTLYSSVHSFGPSFQGGGGFSQSPAHFLPPYVAFS